MLIASLKHFGITNIAGGVMTNDEKSYILAKHWFARLKTFDQWVLRAKKEVLEFAIKHHGSAKACYENYKENMLNLIQETKPKEH